MSIARQAAPGSPARQYLGRLRDDATLRHTALVFSNNVISAIGGMLFWFLATRQLTAAMVGVVSAGTSLTILLAGIGQIGLGMGTIRYGEALGAQRRRRLAGIFALVTVLAWLAGTTLGLLAPALAPGLAVIFGSPLDWAIVAGACAGWAFAVQSDNYLVGRRLTGLLVLKGLITAGLRPLLLVALPGLSPALLIGLTGLSGVLGTLAVAPFVPPYTHGAERAPVGDRELLAFSLWNYLSGLAGTLPALVLPAIVVSLAHPAAAGAYTMAWTLFSALLFAPAALAWVRFAEGSSGEQRDPGMLARAIAGLPVLFLPLALVVLAWLGQEYLAGGWLVLVLLIGGFWPYSQAQLWMAVIRIRGPQWQLTLATAACHLAIIAASLPLLGTLGAPGAALAWSLGQLLFAASLWSIIHFGGAR